MSYIKQRLHSDEDHERYRLPWGLPVIPVIAPEQESVEEGSPDVWASPLPGQPLLPVVSPSEEEIEAARTPRGGYTRETLASWGVPWPPPTGWKRRLLTASRTPIRVPRETGRTSP